MLWIVFAVLKAAAAWSTTGAVATPTAIAPLLSEERHPVVSMSEHNKTAVAPRLKGEMRQRGSGPEVLVGREFCLSSIPHGKPGPYVCQDRNYIGAHFSNPISFPPRHKRTFRVVAPSERQIAKGSSHFAP